MVIVGAKSGLSERQKKMDASNESAGIHLPVVPEKIISPHQPKQTKQLLTKTEAQEGKDTQGSFKTHYSELISIV